MMSVWKCLICTRITRDSDIGCSFIDSIRPRRGCYFDTVQISKSNWDISPEREQTITEKSKDNKWRKNDPKNAVRTWSCVRHSLDIESIVPSCTMCPKSGSSWVCELCTKIRIESEFSGKYNSGCITVIDAPYVTIFRGCHRGEVGQKALERTKEIITRCKQDGKRYFDSSLSSTPSFYEDLNVQWKPPSKPWVVCSKPMIEDAEQGMLGNCWLLAGLATFAQFPSLVEKVLLTRDYCQEGVYAVQLCIDGLWTAVIIDDYLPYKSEGTLLFSKARNNQLWVPLIEKAMAKLYGSYKSLRDGVGRLVLTSLTGVPCQLINIKRINKPKKLWSMLLSSFESNFLVCAATERILQVDKGLMPHHLHSLLEAQYKDGKKFIKLRDPNGVSGWTGKGSEYGNDGGVFWIEFEEFIESFYSVTVCKIRPNDYEFRLKGVFSSSARDSFKILKLKVDVTTEVTLGLFQKDCRGLTNGQRRHDIRLVVVRDVNGGGVGKLIDATSLSGNVHIECHTTLDAGEYLLVPLSFSHLIVDVPPPGVKNPYVISVHSPERILCEEINTRKDHYGCVLADTVILLALKYGKQHEVKPGVISYSLINHRVLIQVIENRKPQAVHVRCHGVEDVNVMSTRGTLSSYDVVPSQHRQVIMGLSGNQRLFALQPPKVAVRLENPDLDLTDWAAFPGMQHDPPLTPETTFLHGPRPI